MATKSNRAHRAGASGNPARRAAAAQRPVRGTGLSVRPARARLNRWSAPVLVRMHALPHWFAPVVMGLALATGLFLPPSLAWLGTALLLFVTLFVGWLFALSWPVLTPAGRLARALVLMGLLGITALRATGRL